MHAELGDRSPQPSSYLAPAPAPSHGPDYVTIDEEEMESALISTEELEGWCERKGPDTPLLDTINYPVHLKNLNIQQLH